MAPGPEMPKFIAPMLAKLTRLPTDESRWAFEIKWDGVRAIARVGPDRLRLMSRNANDMTPAYPELRPLSAALGKHSAVLDGEIVGFDQDGQISFQALQSRMHLRDEAEVGELAKLAPVTYMLFDLLWLDGRDLTGLAYVERRAALDQLGLDDERWQVPEFVRGDGAKLLSVTRDLHLEGVVAKPLDSIYLPGRRTSWIKIKNWSRQEVVIGGWTTGQGSRKDRIGALHLGVYEDQQLSYVGRVGTGFNAAELDRLSELFAPLRRETSPFSGRQPARGAHFVEPELVCEVEFSEWTQTGTLRQASYKGLRDDKPASEVVREPVQEPPTPTKTAATAASGKRTSADRTTSADTAAAPDVQSLIDAGSRVRQGIEIEVEQRTLTLTNIDKVLYPETGFTKGDLIRFYASISPVLLPHLHDRPLTLKRYPNGVDSQFFYEKRSPRHRPEWVQTVTIASSRGDVDFTLCQDLPSLIWLANLADIELHPLLSSAGATDTPKSIVFDLDPGPGTDITDCCAVALALRELFEQLALRAVAKTSGSKGLQVYIPLNDPQASFTQTKTFAHAIAGLLAERLPESVVADMAKAKRNGKVLIDWSQNDHHKTTVSVYSLRATDIPSASTPISWDELSRCAESDDPVLLRFTAERLQARIAEAGDLFSELLTLKQICPDLGA
jgi:bifunctional non-homologous end joining protein LigD